MLTAEQLTQFIKLRACYATKYTGERWRFASSPDKPSYREEALAVHYREHHHNVKPNLKFKLLYSVKNTIMRKIHEAFVINNLKPQINDKEECISVKRFLVSY